MGKLTLQNQKPFRPNFPQSFCFPVLYSISDPAGPSRSKYRWETTMVCKVCSTQQNIESVSRVVQPRIRVFGEIIAFQIRNVCMLW